ncbi:uncharacterized protein LOC113210621 [Frankliniella occidentalis]|uniref:Uncharacterized protein LOC113210621 n=1 Tax=Frankliniella occidentalis TaxID=133901 RepID=A0A9C6XSB3_FRAOC|nr:uncharacterized protein LOC113210621 [Frankliniella occidentalis]
MFLTLCQPTLREDFHTLHLFNDYNPTEPLTRNQVYSEEEEDLNPDEPDPQGDMDMIDEDCNWNSHAMQDIERNSEVNVEEEENRDRGDGTDQVGAEIVVGHEEQNDRGDGNDQVDAEMVVGDGRGRQEVVLSQTGQGRRQRPRNREKTRLGLNHTGKTPGRNAHLN